MLSTGQIIQIAIGFIATAMGIYVVHQLEPTDIDDIVNEKRRELKNWKYHKVLVAIIVLLLAYLAFMLASNVYLCMNSPVCNGSLNVTDHGQILAVLNQSVGSFP